MSYENKNIGILEPYVVKKLKNESDHDVFAFQYPYGSVYYNQPDISFNTGDIY